MKKFPKGSVLFLRTADCRFCGVKVRIIRDRGNPRLIYQEEHTSASGELCEGSDLEVSERGPKRRAKK